MLDKKIYLNNEKQFKFLQEGVTGFYPKLKSFRSCSHMNCCQQNILYINHRTLYNYFIKFNLNLKEFQVSMN